MRFLRVALWLDSLFVNLSVKFIQGVLFAHRTSKAAAISPRRDIVKWN
jgi:hypothetical protein